MPISTSRIGGKVMDTLRKRPRLVSPADLATRLDDAALAAIAEAVGISDEARPRFVQAVRRAALGYPEQAAAPAVAEVRQELTNLQRLLWAALDQSGDREARAAAVDAIRALSDRAIAGLGVGEPGYRFATRADLLAAVVGEPVGLDPGRAAGALPAPEIALDLLTPDEALEHLYGLRVTRLTWATGRKRAGGKRSRPTVRRHLAAPPADPHRPVNAAERHLCLLLAVAYVKATGKQPIYWGPHCPSPFTRLITAVLRACGAPGVDARELVRWYRRRHAKPAAGAKKASSTG